MNSQNYHKVYMNHVHSSTLLSQLSTMWKSQTLCDAMIKTGAVTTRVSDMIELTGIKTLLPLFHVICFVLVLSSNKLLVSYFAL